MKFKRVSWYKFADKENPEGKGIAVLEDDVGWLYLQALTKIEGLATPFSTIQEIEVYLDGKLELIRVDKITEEMRREGYRKAGLPYRGEN